MTKKEAIRQAHQEHTLLDLGFTRTEAEALRRISLTLHRWYELECGDSNTYGSWAIERDDNGDGPPFMVRHHYMHGRGKDTVTRTRIPDRETGAIKRLKAILAARNAREVRHTTCDRCGHDIEGCAPFTEWRDRGNNAGDEHHRHAPNKDDHSFGAITFYLQTDPRGASLYILRPGDVPEGQDAGAYYNRGICVY